jgi:hypothetical protein
MQIDLQVAFQLLVKRTALEGVRVLSCPFESAVLISNGDDSAAETCFSLAQSSSKEFLSCQHFLRTITEAFRIRHIFYILEQISFGPL